MPPSPDVQEYQQNVVRMLKQIYPGIAVSAPWAAMSGERDVYSPQVDIAVGPFATQDILIEEYSELMDLSREFYEQVIEFHNENISVLEDWSTAPRITFPRLKSKNKNARCLLVVEIENKVSRKHLMGGAVNAAALGRVGIVVGWTQDKHKAFLKLRRYFHFLARVGKNTYDTTNLIILKKHQLLQALESVL